MKNKVNEGWLKYQSQKDFDNSIVDYTTTFITLYFVEDLTLHPYKSIV